ncbi:uncharacterized protein LOC144137439 [Haemaphysalis longicornis]
MSAPHAGHRYQPRFKGRALQLSHGDGCTASCSAEPVAASPFFMLRASLPSHEAEVERRPPISTGADRGRGWIHSSGARPRVSAPPVDCHGLLTRQPLQPLFTGCREESEAELCSACGELINDRFLLRVSDSSWHARCLRCCVCGAPLDRQPSCFVRHGNVYCRHNYVR